MAGYRRLKVRSDAVGEALHGVFGGYDLAGGFRSDSTGLRNLSYDPETCGVPCPSEADAGVAIASGGQPFRPERQNLLRRRAAQLFAVNHGEILRGDCRRAAEMARLPGRQSGLTEARSQGWQCLVGGEVQARRGSRLPAEPRLDLPWGDAHIPRDRQVERRDASQLRAMEPELHSCLRPGLGVRAFLQGGLRPLHA